MNLTAIKNIVTSKAGRQLLLAQKHSPAILFGAGIVGMVGTVVLASRATLKVGEVLEEHEYMVDKIKTVERADYSEDDRQKDMVVHYIQTATKLTKLYAPAVLTGALTIVCLTQSHRILTQRNAGLMAAYTALDKGFRAYRERVVADLGEDKDREYRHGAETVDRIDDQGKKVKIRQAAGEPSIYAKLWGRDTTGSWSEQSDYNLLFLKSNQNYLNDQLQARGHVYLNEAYDQLGLPHTKEGAVVGWIKGQGDNYIDFGIFNEQMQPQHLDFFSGREDAIWLDFNVDGVMYDKI